MTAALAKRPPQPPSVVVPLRQGIVPRSSDKLRADYEACAAFYLRAVFNGGSVEIVKARANAMMALRSRLVEMD